MRAIFGHGSPRGEILVRERKIYRQPLLSRLARKVGVESAQPLEGFKTGLGLRPSAGVARLRLETALVVLDNPCPRAKGAV